MTKRRRSWRRRCRGGSFGRGYFVDNRKDRKMKAVGGGAIAVDERLESAATHHGSLHFKILHWLDIEKTM